MIIKSCHNSLLLLVTMLARTIIAKYRRFVIFVRTKLRSLCTFNQASFVFPDSSGTSTIARLMRVNSFAKTKTNEGNFPLRHWKTIEIIKIVRFQSLNFTSKPKRYLQQTTKLWEKLIVLNGRKKKATKPKRRSKLFCLNRVKFVKMTVFYSL